MWHRYLSQLVGWKNPWKFPNSTLTLNQTFHCCQTIEKEENDFYANKKLAGCMVCSSFSKQTLHILTLAHSEYLLVLLNFSKNLYHVKTSSYENYHKTFFCFINTFVFVAYQNRTSPMHKNSGHLTTGYTFPIFF